MIKIAVPNKGSLSEAAVEILTEAGYKGRGHSKALNVVDSDNGVEFFFLRPKDIAIYVARGVLDLGITGRDLALDSKASFDEVLPLGFGGSTFRYAAPQGEEWDISQLAGRRIATIGDDERSCRPSFPNRLYLLTHFEAVAREIPISAATWEIGRVRQRSIRRRRPSGERGALACVGEVMAALSDLRSAPSPGPHARPRRSRCGSRWPLPRSGCCRWGAA